MKPITGYILEQFPRTRKQYPYFMVFRTKKLAQDEIMGLPKDGKPEVYKVELVEITKHFKEL